MNRMIRLHGSVEGLEGAAAQQLRDFIVRAWPWVETDAAGSVDLVIGVKCHGQAATKDLDVVLLATFPPKARFNPFLSFLRRWDNQWVRPSSVRVESLCIILEIKHCDPGDVRFIGTRLEVYYRNDARPKWHNASEQSHKQIFALKNYIESQGPSAPFITNLIWLVNVEKDQLPPRPHNIIGANMNWELLLNVACQVRAPEADGSEWIMRAWPEGSAYDSRAVVRLLSQRIEPTRLDKVRMARICEEAIRPEWLADLSNRQMILRGRGGTGKTMLLLQLAWRAFQDQGARTLILTYNTALLADIRRLLTLVGDAHGLRDRGIQAQSIMAFFASAFRGLGLLTADKDYLEDYAALKAEALSLVTAADATSLVREQTEAFGWDFIFIDEGQDWPEDERDLLRRFYSPVQFVVADGMDQFVRGQAPCDWQGGLAKSTVRPLHLSLCLRMKANLAHFANQFASALGLPGWSIDANVQAPGGRVIVIEGDPFEVPGLYQRLIDLNAEAGNQPVDMLLCVPPALVRRSVDAPPQSLVGERLAAAGFPVWDGVSTTIRDSYPLSVSQLRIVQYDSCRGLEGWVVVAFGLDELYRYKRETWQPPAAEPGAFADDPEEAHRHAARWLMIPLSRAVDTLVIQVEQLPSRTRDALGHAAEACRDFVEWRVVGH
jgi:hypothetical protein